MGELTQFQQALQVSSISKHAPNNQGANSNGNNQHQARAPQNQNQNQQQNQNQNSNQNKGYNNPNYQQHSGRGRGRGYGGRGGFRRQVRQVRDLQENLKDGQDFVTGVGTMFLLKKQTIC